MFPPGLVSLIVRAGRTYQSGDPSEMFQNLDEWTRHAYYPKWKYSVVWTEVGGDPLTDEDIAAYETIKNNPPPPPEPPEPRRRRKHQYQDGMFYWGREYH